MIFFKHNKKKAIIHIKECILLGSSATGKSREFPVPFSDITGGELLDALLIDGKLAESYENSFSDEEIYTALLKCQRSLNKNCNFFYPNYPEGCKGCFTGFSSKRQICCLRIPLNLLLTANTIMHCTNLRIV